MGYNSIPPHIANTLDDMAYGISVKENLDSYEVKQTMVKNIDRLAPQDLGYLVEQMSILIDRSVQDEESIDENSVEKDFISFLIRLYY